MKNLPEELRELRERVEMSSTPLDLPRRAISRIRRRQITTVAFAGALIVGLVGGSLMVLERILVSPVTQRLSPVAPLATSPISVTVGTETHTLTAEEIDGRTEIWIRGTTSEGTLGSLPLPKEIMPLVITDPLRSGDWAILGVVPDETARVQIAVTGGPSVEATLFALPGEAGTTLKAFAAEGRGEPFLSSAWEIRALDQSDRVIVTETRPASDPVDAGSG